MRLHYSEVSPQDVVVFFILPFTVVAAMVFGLVIGAKIGEHNALAIMEPSEPSMIGAELALCNDRALEALDSIEVWITRAHDTRQGLTSGSEHKYNRDREGEAGS